jgi:hypothetical protein
MASGVTNIGKIRILEMAFRNTESTAAMSTQPFMMALATSAATLAVTTTTFDTATQISTGNGYNDGGSTAGIIVRDTVDWDTLAIDTASNYGYIRLKDIVWTASGGNLPDTGTGAYYSILTDTNATVGSREVYAWFDLSEARTIGSGATLTLQDMEIRLT